MSRRLGSLFSGYGGLDLAVEEVFGARTVWNSDIEPGPRKVLAHRFPDVPNLGDITTVDWSQVEPVDIIAGGSPCFPAGTLVDTVHGYRPIETIGAGDLVLTHRGRYMPVVQTMRRHATDAIHLNVQGVPEFVTTAEHPFYVRHRTKVWDNSIRRYVWQWDDPHWVAASHLTKDHFVGYQIDQPSEPAIGPALAYLIGRWLGDGWIRNGTRASTVERGQRGSRVNSRWWQVFICDSDDKADEVQAAITAAGYVASKFKEPTVTKFRINSKDLVQKLAGFGRGAAGKKLPGWAFRLPLEDQRALWRGWVDSDGSVKASTGQIRITTVSAELAHGMARIGRNVFRRAPSVHYTKTNPTTVIEGRIVNQRPQYQVCLSVRNRDAWNDGDWIWAPVRGVSPAHDAQVFNIGVQEDESYTAWGITVHNCQDISGAGRMAGMREGTRSNLWVEMREAIRVLQPAYVIWENVYAARSTAAASAMESDPRLLGDHPAGVPVLRALGRVLGDLASLGFDAEWHSLRASEIGAPHGRARYFIVAVTRDPARRADVATHPENFGHQWSGDARLRWPGPAHGHREPVALLPTPTTQDAANTAGPSQLDRNSLPLNTVVTLLPTRATRGGSNTETVKLLPTPDANLGNGGRQRSAEALARGDHQTNLSDLPRLLPTPSVADSTGGHERRGGKRGDELLLKGIASHQAWGPYRAAVERWEAVHGPAPAPTKPGRNGRPKLNPEFASWMMGVPAGWITDVPGVSDNESLKMAGNGVVPQQAVAALRTCLAHLEAVGGADPDALPLPQTHLAALDKVVWP